MVYTEATEHILFVGKLTF